MLSDTEATVLRNGTATTIATTVTHDGNGRLVATFVVPANAQPSETFHVSMTALLDGRAVNPHTLLVGNVRPDTLSPDGMADSVWNAATQDYQAFGSFGHKVGMQLLTFCKWIGLR